MSARAALQSIPVVVMPPGPVAHDAPTTASDAPRAVLHEIAALLDRLLSHGESGRIDVRSLPLSPPDLAALRALLGDGAVQIGIDALGESEASETGYPGVWWIVHRDASGGVMAELIEVAAVPSIVVSPREDIVGGRARMQRALAGDDFPEDR
jgi:hydrogenase-1 operon protein HyaF